MNEEPVSERKRPVGADPKTVSVDIPLPPLPVRIAERPIVVRLGKTRKKRVKDLRRGTGKLMDKVRSAVEIVAADLGTEAAGQTLQPVVLVYKERYSAKRRRRGGPQGLCPVCCI
jgi:hypothetical protein